MVKEFLSRSQVTNTERGDWGLFANTKIAMQDFKEHTHTHQGNMIPPKEHGIFQ
jgi:hypothetical protein